MSLQVHVAIALALAALGLAPGAAHVLELPVKLQYSDEQYAQVTGSLYAWFGAVGGAVQAAAAVAVGLLAFRLRRSPQGGLVVAAALALIASLLLWGAMVAPVNSAWADLGSSATASDVAAAYARLRARWEFGHVAAFIAWLTGWLGLVGFASARFR